MSKCPECGSKQVSQPLSSTTVFACGSRMNGNRLLESMQCLRNQLSNKDAEITKLKSEVDKAEALEQHHFVNLNLEIERLQKIVDACEWSDVAISPINGKKVRYCNTCRQPFGFKHLSTCLFYKERDGK